MGRYDFACNVGVERVGSDGWAETLRVHCYWKCNGWRYNMSPVYGWVTCNGEERLVANGIAVNFQNNQGKYELGWSDFRIDRTQSDRSIAYSARLKSDSSYTYGERSSGTQYHTVGKLASHTVSYNANGGSGAPGNQTKWYGSTLTLSSTKPTRTGYTFQGWATSAGGGVVYQPGQGYGNDANVTLYAVWKANTWTVKYNANGGSGAPADQTKTYGQTLKLSSTKPTRLDYNFKGWATSKANADKGTVSYAAGANYTSDAAITLYAVWELAYVRPRITNLMISRCDSAGNISESGTYLRYDFKWATDLTGVYIQCQWKPQTAAWGSSSQKSTTILSNSSSKSGTITKKVVGSGAVSAEQSWSARVYIYDSKGTSYATYSSDVSIGTTKYPIDVRKQGVGIAFGKVAELDNVTDNNYKLINRKEVENQGTVYNMSGDTIKSFNGISGKTGYIKICVFKISSEYVNQYIELNILQRNRYSTLHIVFQSVNNNDPKNCTIISLGNIEAYMYHSNTSEWSLYIRKSEAYDNIELSRLHKGSYMKGVSITYTNELVDTLPEGCVKNVEYVDQRKKILYNNNSGTTGTVTLSETAANFNYIEIFYKCTEYSYFNSVKVSSPNNKVANLGTTHVFSSSETAMIDTRKVKISATSISNEKGDNNDFGTLNTWNNSIDKKNRIAITKVVGYYRG